MSRIYHGRIDLKWCQRCRSPVLRGSICPGCSMELQEVAITPPGDVQPAFPFDIEMIGSVIDSQWGDGIFRHIWDGCSPILINPCPSPDRLLEVIMDGKVIGSLKYDVLSRSYLFILREAGGEVLRSRNVMPEKGWVMADPTAVPFLMDGKNLLSPGIIDVSEEVRSGDEVLVIDPDRNIIGSGASRKDSSGMVGTRGMGVKMRWCSEDEAQVPEHECSDKGFEDIWEQVVDLNRPLLWKDISASRKFIEDEIEGSGLPYAVSFSGGKDSLATLLLVIGAGYAPPVLFVDTGLEFPETMKHVDDIVEDLDLELVKGVPRSSFFDELETFGPPGRDHRWCCKVCKLGPMSELINKRFPEGVLTFIGQRRYESDSRKSKGSVWKNPWVPGQIGASPIQDWNALQVWLYIFLEGATYNPLYNRGYQRIGCWLCPSCDMAENDLIEGTDIDPSRWKSALSSFKEKGGLPDEWVDLGFHRFKKQPPHMKVLAEELGIDIDDLSLRGRSKISGIITMVKGTSSCIDGISREGRLGDEVPWDRLNELLNILGPVQRDEATGGIYIRPDKWRMKRDMIELYPDGTIIIRGPDRSGIERTTDALVSVLKRSAGCIGCSICVGRCPNKALSVIEGPVMLDSDICTHCGSCLGPCPAEDFTEDPFLI